MGPYQQQQSVTTPLARVRGLGSAKDGTAHFIAQRLTAIALVPLIFWIVCSLIGQIGVPREAFIAWAGGLGTATLLVLFLLASFWHMALGLQVVVEDYIHHELTKLMLLAVVRLSAIGFALLGILSVLKLALGS